MHTCMCIYICAINKHKYVKSYRGVHVCKCKCLQMGLRKKVVAIEEDEKKNLILKEKK